MHDEHVLFFISGQIQRKPSTSYYSADQELRSVLHFLVRGALQLSRHWVGTCLCSSCSLQPPPLIVSAQPSHSIFPTKSTNSEASIPTFFLREPKQPGEKYMSGLPLASWSCRKYDRPQRSKPDNVGHPHMFLIVPDASQPFSQFFSLGSRFTFLTTS